MAFALPLVHGHRHTPVTVEFHGFHFALPHVDRIALGQAYPHFRRISALPFGLFYQPGSRIFGLL